MSGLRRWQIDPGCDAVGEMARARTLSCLSLAATYGQAAWLRHSQSRPPPIQRRRTNNLPPSLEEESKYPATASLSLVREMPETSSANLRDCGADIAFRPSSALAALYVRLRPSRSRADLAPGRPIGANIPSPHLTSAQVTGRLLSLFGKLARSRPQFLEALLPHQFLKLTASAEVRMQFLRDQAAQRVEASLTAGMPVALCFQKPLSTQRPRPPFLSLGDHRLASILEPLDPGSQRVTFLLQFINASAKSSAGSGSSAMLSSVFGLLAVIWFRGGR